MAKSKKNKAAKTYRTFKHFIAHVDTHEDLQGVAAGAQVKAKWAGYAVALGAVESIVDEGKSSKKVKKRQRQTIKYLHKLAKHANGKKSVRPPKAPVLADEVSVEPATDNVVSLEAVRTEVPAHLVRGEKQPAMLSAPKNGVADDLKMIAGVGPKLEELLHDLGIYHFEQIAKWTPAEVMWVDEHLRFSGRITREDWINQAAALAKGGRDEYVRVFGKEPR